MCVCTADETTQVGTDLTSWQVFYTHPVLSRMCALLVKPQKWGPSLLVGSFFYAHTVPDLCVCVCTAGETTRVGTVLTSWQMFYTHPVLSCMCVLLVKPQ